MKLIQKSKSTPGNKKFRALKSKTKRKVHVGPFIDPSTIFKGLPSNYSPSFLLDDIIEEAKGISKSTKGEYKNNVVYEYLRNELNVRSVDQINEYIINKKLKKEVIESWLDSGIYFMPFSYALLTKVYPDLQEKLAGAHSRFFDDLMEKRRKYKNELRTNVV